MATRCKMAPAAAIGPIVLAIVGLMVPQIRAVDPPTAAAQPPVWTGLVPDDAFVAMVLCPKRVLTSAGMEKFDIKGMIAGAEQWIGGSPVDMEQFVSIMGPSLDKHFPQQELIIRLSPRHGGAEWATKYFAPAPAEEAEIAGHKYFHAGKTSAPGAMVGAPAICFLDDRTLLMVDESWIANVFASKDAKSELISALATIDPAADATLIFTRTDTSGAALAEMFPARAFPGPLRPLGDLPGLLQAATVTIGTNPEISLKLSLTGIDEASADKIDQTLKSLQQLGEAFLPALQAPPDEKMPAEQRESREYATGMATKLVEGLVPHLSGKQVTVEIDKLGTPDALVGRLLVPAIKSARSAAQRSRSANNLKQLALAMHEYNSAYGHFPAHAIYSKAGKPLLSWRVQMLPYLDEQELYKQFHLDEPWGSPNNKPLIAKMPAVFKSAGGKPPGAGQTRYVVPCGKDAVFEGDEGIPISKITDGTSKTILVLEVGEDKAVTWTQPDDMDFDTQKPLAGLGTISDDRFAAAFADGSVRQLPKDIDAETFRRLIIRNDGLPIDWKKL